MCQVYSILLKQSYTVRLKSDNCRGGEMVSAIDSKSIARKGVGVQVSPAAQIIIWMRHIRYITKTYSMRH